jgi:hypothetical protein
LNYTRQKRKLFSDGTKVPRFLAPNAQRNNRILSQPRSLEAFDR